MTLMTLVKRQIVGCHMAPNCIHNNEMWRKDNKRIKLDSRDLSWSRITRLADHR